MLWWHYILVYVVCSSEYLSHERCSRAFYFHIHSANGTKSFILESLYLSRIFWMLSFENTPSSSYFLQYFIILHLKSFLLLPVRKCRNGVHYARIRVLNNLPSSITSIADETEVFKKTLEMVSYG